MSTPVFKKTAFAFDHHNFIIIASSYTTLQTARVKVEGGWLHGAVEGDLTVFKGIAFAAPPVG